MNLKISMFYVSLGLVFLNLVCFSLFNPLHVKADTTSTSETWISTDLDVEDSFISSEYPSTNYSSSQYLVNGKHQTFGTTRSFLKFKLPINN